MPNFIVYDSNGFIIRSGGCSNPRDITLQAQEGEYVMEIDGDPEMIANGETKIIVDGQILDRPPSA